MKRTVLIFAVVVALLIGFTVDSRAAMCGNCMAMSGEGPMMGDGMVGMMIKHLALDAKQASAFKAIHLKMKKESIQKKAELEIAELELGELRGSDPVDMKTAEAKIRQIEALRSDMKILHLKAHEEVRGMLTPEQKIKLESFMEKRMGGGMGMMRNCRMMEDKGGMGRMRHMEEGDMQGEEGGEEHDMPSHEGHGH